MPKKKPVTPHVTVVLKLPRPVPAFLIAATNIVDAMTAGKATFPAPTPTLAVVSSHIADLTSKESAAKNRTSGAVEQRDTSQQVLTGDLKSLRGYVEIVANGDPANADAIAKAAGMSLRKPGSHNKPLLAAKSSGISGTVKVVAKAIVGAKVYDWEYSTDGGKTWTSVPSSTKALTQIPNLTVGATVMFRHRAITKVGPQDWGQPISALVN